MRMVIDRFEGDRAVCRMDDGSWESIPIRELPEGARPGMTIRDGAIDVEDSRKRADSIRGKMEQLFKKRGEADE